MRRIGIRGQLAEGLEVFGIPLWLKLAGVWEPNGAHVNSVNVIHNTCGGGYRVAHVNVVLCDGMSYRAEDGGGHPAERLFHDTADVLEVSLILRSGRRLGPTTSILAFPLDFWEEEYGLH